MGSSAWSWVTRFDPYRFNRDITKKSNLGFNIGYGSSQLNSFVQFILEYKLNFHYSIKFPNLPTWFFGQRLTHFYEDNGTNI